MKMHVGRGRARRLVVTAGCAALLLGPLFVSGARADTSSQTISLSSTPNPSTVGQPVTVTATVTAGDVGATVDFFDMSQNFTHLGAAPVGSDLQASIQATSLSTGQHQLVALIGPGQSSNIDVQTVNGFTVSVSLTANPNSSQFGQPVEMSVQVSAGPGGPSLTGATVDFQDLSNQNPTLGSTALDSSGYADLAVDSLAVGSHVLSATLHGGPYYGQATSNNVTEVVQKADTTTRLSSSSNPSGLALAVTFTASVTPAFTGQPTGTVTFRDGNTTLGTAAVHNSRASLTTSTLLPGDHPVSADYSGDNNFNLSLAPTIHQQVDICDPTDTICQPSPLQLP